MNDIHGSWKCTLFGNLELFLQVNRPLHMAKTEIHSRRRKPKSAMSPGPTAVGKSLDFSLYHGSSAASSSSESSMHKGTDVAAGGYTSPRNMSPGNLAAS